LTKELNIIALVKDLPECSNKIFEGVIEMKIAHFCTQDDGGAGRAALRLNKGLNQIGEDSTLFVKVKTTDNPTVLQIQSSDFSNKVSECVQKFFFSNVYTGNTICSIMYPGIDFSFFERLQDFDIINLHWIPTMVSLEDICKIRAMGKPIVWTLHDQNPMTGACHYTHGCEKYKSDCSDCPQLKDNIYNVTRAVLEAKVKHLPKDLVVVTPSHWLAGCAKESMVFRNHHIEVIPYSLETDVYKPINKIDAKTALGFPATAKVILFGAQDLNEKRKGLTELIEAAKHLRTDDKAKQLIEYNQLYILLFGYPSPLIESIGIPYKTVGYINREEMLSLVYSAADVVALPSLEDNLPNIMLESMACGTPVVAFATGGMNDVIKNGKNGFLVPLKDTESFATRLLDSITGEPMENYCRLFAEENYRLDIQANSYKALFQRLVRECPAICVNGII